MLFQKPKKAQAGQVLLMIAILSPILLGMVGLPIDGGRLLLKHRDAENAVDAAARAGTFEFCRSGNADVAIAKAEELAMLNGYIDDEMTSVTVETYTYNTYVNGWPTVRAGTKVTITAEIKKTLSAIIYWGKLQTTLVAVVECNTTNVHISGRTTLFAESQNCQNAVNGAQANITCNGGITSNESTKLTGSNLVVNGQINTFQYESDAVLNPATNNPNYLTSPVEMPEMFTLSQFRPGGGLALQAQSEGLYEYYSSNQNFNFNGADKDKILKGLVVVDGNCNFVGDMQVDPNIGVSIVCAGKFSASATNITMNSYISGLLIYSDAPTNCGYNAIDLSTSSTTLRGIMYAPSGGIKISAANTTAEVAVFGQTIDLHGDNITINWYGDLANLAPPSEMWRAE